jgi:IPT/TIG domain
VMGCDFVATAPGQPVTISGKNFSKVASENVVTIGGESCSVTSASETSLLVTVSSSLGMSFPVWDAVVKVTVDGVESKGDNVKVNIGQRVIPNEGTPQY